MGLLHLVHKIEQLGLESCHYDWVFFWFEELEIWGSLTHKKLKCGKTAARQDVLNTVCPRQECQVWPKFGTFPHINIWVPFGSRAIMCWNVRWKFHVEHILGPIWHAWLSSQNPVKFAHFCLFSSPLNFNISLFRGKNVSIYLKAVLFYT